MCLYVYMCVDVCACGFVGVVFMAVKLIMVANDVRVISINRCIRFMCLD